MRRPIKPQSPPSRISSKSSDLKIQNKYDRADLSVMANCSEAGRKDGGRGIIVFGHERSWSVQMNKAGGQGREDLPGRRDINKGLG